MAEWGNKFVNTQVPNDSVVYLRYLRLIKYMRFEVSKYLYFHRELEPFSNISDIINNVKNVVKDIFERGKLNEVYIYLVEEKDNELHLTLVDKKHMFLSTTIMWNMEIINNFKKSDFKDEESDSE